MDAVATPVFSGITGGIGSTEDFGQCPSIFIDGGQANADPDAKGFILPDKSEVLNGHPHFFGQELGMLQRTLLE